MKKLPLSLLMTALLCGASLQAAPLTPAQLQPLWENPTTSAQQLVKAMTLRQQIGQLMNFDFRNWETDLLGNPVPVTAINPEIQDVIARYHLGGVAIFRENLIDTTQSIDLLKAMQQASDGLPLLLLTDQEGGYVTRLRVGTEMPGNMALGATRNPALAELTGMVHGQELAQLGLNVNYGPVVDVNTNQANPVIGVRSYSDRAELVNQMAKHYIAGIHKTPVLTVAKHFPGHGNVAVDSHFGIPEVPYSLAEWRKHDLPAFQAAIANGVDAIMTAHVVLPAVDDSTLTTLKGETMGRPSTLSKPIITGILRQELGFKGLIMTDAMDMGAIADNFDPNWATEQALLAGVDIITMPFKAWGKADVAKIEQLYTYLEQQAAKNPELQQRIAESAQRVVQQKLTAKLTATPPDTTKANDFIASDFNKSLEAMVANYSVTLIKNEGVLPYYVKPHNNITVISDERSRNSLIADKINRSLAQLGKAKATIQRHAVNLQGDNLSAHQAEQYVDQQDLIILASYNLVANPHNAQRIIDAANKLKRPLVVISTRNPYDIAHLKNVSANIAIYGITGFDVTNNQRNSLEANITSGINTLFADGITRKALNNPLGKLPVDIKDAQGKTVVYPFGTGLSY